MESAIRINDLCIGYKEKDNIKTVCNLLNASLPEGSLTCLIGVNGSGKSTLLRTLAGFLPPVSGNAYIHGSDIKKMTYHQKAKAIGIVLTEKPDIQHFSAREIVSLGRSPYTGFFDKLTDEDNRIIDDSINKIGINDIKDRLVDTLSDGERQKVMIAKVLAQQTPIILLDEPTAFLDYPSKIEVLELLREMAHDMGKTIILSTHDLGTSLNKVDQIWLMTKNKELKTGRPDDFKLGLTMTSEQIINLFK
jgi:iron complex transport system ATP-binding protein